MRSVRDVHGEIYRCIGIFSLATAGVLMSCFVPSHSLSKFLGLEVPCLGLGLLSGVLYVFWIALARDVYGRGWGTVVSALIVSILLLNGPWYGIVNPPYFGLFGFVSFVLMGILTDFVNGGLGSVVCLATNWLAFWQFKGVTFSLPIALIVLLATFVSGFVFDLLARKMAVYVVGHVPIIKGV